MILYNKVRVLRTLTHVVLLYMVALFINGCGSDNTTNNVEVDQKETIKNESADVEEDYLQSILPKNDLLFEGNLDKGILVDSKGNMLIEDFRKDKKGNNCYYVMKNNKKVLCKISLKKEYKNNMREVVSSSMIENYLLYAMADQSQTKHILYSYNTSSRKKKNQSIDSGRFVTEGTKVYTIKNNKIYVFDKSLTVSEIITDKSIVDDTVIFSVKNGYIFYLTNNSIFVYDKKQRTCKKIFGDNEIDIVKNEITVYKEGIYFVGLSEEKSNLYMIDEISNKIKIISNNISDFTRTRMGVYYTKVAGDDAGKTYRYANGKETIISDSLAGNDFVGTADGLILLAKGVTDGGLLLYNEKKDKIIKIYQY